MSAALAILPAQWPAPANIRAFSTLRTGPGASVRPFDAFNLGLRCGDQEAAVLANRSALLELLGTALPPRWLHQVHGVGVVRARLGDESTEVVADAAVTDEPGLPLAILTADCLPVLFCAEDGSEVGAAHAGWRGLAAGVLEATVAAMHTSPARLLAWLGPCAGPQAYEVGEDVHTAFVAGDAGAARFFSPSRPGHWLVDLPALARRRLAAAGVERVFGGSACTISEPARFYSHRRDGTGGRLASVVLIEPERA